MLTVLKSANLVLAFALELCALAAVAYWGWHADQRMVVRIALAVAAPLVVAVFWGVFLAPQAAVPVGEPWHMLLEAMVFAIAGGSLIVAGRPLLGWALMALFAVNALLAYIWHQ